MNSLGKSAPQVIQKLVLKNFRRFRSTAIGFAAGLNILVGDNEAGKSAVLGAINLALSSRWQGKFFSGEFAPRFPQPRRNDGVPQRRGRGGSA
ncbi:MAG: ATP-binding protein [Marmoricola sp.]